MSAVPKPPWTLAFHDGAANGYRFSHPKDGAATFAYDPVTPERSSTGTYSGGEPASGDLSDGDASELWSRVAGLEAATSLHGENRNKGTGAFRIESAAGTRSFIIERSPELDTFVAYLKRFR